MEFNGVPVLSEIMIKIDKRKTCIFFQRSTFVGSAWSFVFYTRFYIFLS